jgi:hypothetical protein
MARHAVEGSLRQEKLVVRHKRRCGLVGAHEMTPGYSLRCILYIGAESANPLQKSKNRDCSESCFSESLRQSGIGVLQVIMSRRCGKCSCRIRQKIMLLPLLRHPESEPPPSTLGRVFWACYFQARSIMARNAALIDSGSDGHASSNRRRSGPTVI